MPASPIPTAITPTAIPIPPLACVITPGTTPTTDASARVPQRNTTPPSAGPDWRRVDDYPPPLPPMSTQFDPRSPKPTQGFWGFLVKANGWELEASCCQRPSTALLFRSGANFQLYHLFAFVSSKKRHFLDEKTAIATRDLQSRLPT
jgi:hypothetical protein